MNISHAATSSAGNRQPGLLRRSGRALLGGAAILIVGVGGMSSADASAAGIATGPSHTATASTASADTVGPAALPVENRASAARFVVGKNGSLTRTQ